MHELHLGGSGNDGRRADGKGNLDDSESNGRFCHG
jgi:hypothetical protein